MSVQINLVLYFHQTRVRKRRKQNSVLKHLNLGKVVATAGAMEALLDTLLPQPKYA